MRELVLPEMKRHGPIEAWIIDDTGFPKKGQHSVGVARQYCGELGKQDNCQVAVALSIANHDASLPVAYRLYLPKEWASDRKRRRKVGVPDEIGFKTKPEIALTQIRWACEAGLPRGAVLMDAGYGVDTDLRTSITALGLSYVAGIQSHTTVWAPGTGPRPPKKWSGHGRPPKLLRRDDKRKPASVKELALALPKRAWRTITWREGTGEKLSSRFARVCVRVAHRDYWLADSRPKEWLLIEWPDGDNEPIKYWLSTLPEDAAFRQLVDIAKLRWRIERDYQELKQEVGLGHFEGRGWRGFHHHATLCIAAYGFLISERETIPPSGDRATTLYPQFALREGHQPRGSARCGLSATFRTRLQRCDGDWWPLSPRRSHVAHAAPLGTDTKICDTVRLGCGELARKRREKPHDRPMSLPSFVRWHAARQRPPAGFRDRLRPRTTFIAVNGPSP